MSTEPDEEATIDRSGSASPTGAQPTDGDPAGYEWPEDTSGGQEYRAGFYLLAIMYSAPFLILLLFPSLAWLALLPFAIALRWNAHPPHRRRLVWIYVITGVISFAPWLPWLLGQL